VHGRAFKPMHMGLVYLFLFFKRVNNLSSAFIFKKKFTREMSHAKEDNMLPANPYSLLLKIKT
jgi:hypothetical protein